MSEYKEGQGQEIELFPQVGDIYKAPEKAKDIPNEYPSRLYEALHLARIRAELKNLRRRK